MYRPPPPASAPYGGAAYPTYPSQPQGGYQAPYVPPTPNYAYTPPPPVAQAPSDPFRTYYASRLSQLTFNSRPIIQDLSVMAMQQRDAQNWQNMQTVVEEIEAAVLRAAPNAKLPILYLIDSISKNVGAPFTTDLLRPVIPRLYQRTYREVDGVTKAKMEEMIALWRTAGPNGTDLYGPDVRFAIERDILGTAGAFTRSQQPAPPTRETVLSLLHTTLDIKQRESIARPWDNTPKHQIGILRQIGDLLARTQVSHQELQHIMDQLRSMAPPPPAPPAVQQHYPAARPQPTLPPFPPAMPPMAPTLSTPTQHSITPVQGSNTPIPPPSSTPLPAPTAIPAGLPANVADILRNLNSSGILSNPLTPETKPATLTTPSGLEAYEEMILNLDLRLENLDLNRMSALPTAHLPQRCKQCGIRFPEGESKMQAHLDWHFRRNKQKTETDRGRGAHRRWLPRAEEWVADSGTNAEAGPSTAKTATEATGGTKLSAEQLKRYAQRTVRVPMDPARAGKPCPICKEHFKAELEDDEWIWRNAIEIGSLVYHATCRAEQMNARKNARILNPNGRLSASKSPGITPQPGEVDVKVEIKHSPMALARSAVVEQTSSEPASIPVETSEVKAESIGEEVESGGIAPGVPVDEQEHAMTVVDVHAIASQTEATATTEDGVPAVPVKRKAENEEEGLREEETKRVKVDEENVEATKENLPAIASTETESQEIPPVDEASEDLEGPQEAALTVETQAQTMEPIQVDGSTDPEQVQLEDISELEKDEPVEGAVDGQDYAQQPDGAMPDVVTETIAIPQPVPAAVGQPAASMFDGIPGFGRM